MILVLFIIGLAMFVFGVANIVATMSKSTLDHNKELLLESRRTLNDAETALRHISNGSSDNNSVLEAQIALEAINTYHEKELS